MHRLTLVVTTKPQQGEDWIRFHSRREAVRYTDLAQQQARDDIRELRRQVAFPLLVCSQTAKVNGRFAIETIGRYIADFVYIEPEPGTSKESWRQVVEDCKGWKTEMYRWKKKHFEAQYGMTIRET